jgi:micrococcal nuclease
MSHVPSTRTERRWTIAFAVGIPLALLAGVVTAGWVTHRVYERVMSGDPIWTGDNPSYDEPTVIEVIDGDTIVVQTGYRRDKVRLLGIDTPETKDPRRPVQCFGEEASRRTTELLPPGTEVRLVGDVEERDRYDRVLAYVYRASDSLFVNLELARDGYADLLTYPPNVAHTSELTAAVAEARREQRGLWQACGGPGRPA